MIFLGETLELSFILAIWGRPNKSNLIFFNGVTKKVCWRKSTRISLRVVSHGRLSVVEWMVHGLGLDDPRPRGRSGSPYIELDSPCLVVGHSMSTQGRQRSPTTPGSRSREVPIAGKTPKSYFALINAMSWTDRCLIRYTGEVGRCSSATTPTWCSRTAVVITGGEREEG